MVDREKVLTWLEICGKNNTCSDCCPYSEYGIGEYGGCHESLMADAYDLLKEQEPVKPRYTPKSIYSWECGVCAEPFDRIANYCPNCGRKVQWE